MNRIPHLLGLVVVALATRLFHHVLTECGADEKSPMMAFVFFIIVGWIVYQMIQGATNEKTISTTTATSR